MYWSTHFTSVTLALAATFANAQVLDCRGSIGCATTTVTIRDLQTIVNAGLDDNRQFGDNTQIACLNTTCAFFQNTGRTTNTGSLAKSLIQQLINRGCTKCGSQFIDRWVALFVFAELRLTSVVEPVGRRES